MRQRLFLDANVVMDIAFKREEFLADSIKLLALEEEGLVEFYVSTLTLSHIAYFSKKFGTKPREVVSIILKWVTPVDLKVSHFEDAIVSRFSDFEDALQYFSALDVKGVDFLITRNEKDFKSAELTVLSPKEFVAMYSSGT